MRQTTRLHVSMRRGLHLAPGVQLALEFLQSPAEELQARLRREAEANPLLDLVEAEEEADPASGVDSLGAVEAAAPGSSDPNPEETRDPWGEIDAPFPDDGDVAAAPRGVLEAQEFAPFEGVACASAYDALVAQLRLEQSDSEVLRLGSYLIGCLDDRGYLGASLAEIAADLGVEVVTLGPVLRAVQQLDPPGLGARDLRECLLLQLERRGEADLLPARILRDHFPALAARRDGEIARKLRVEPLLVAQALREIRKLEARPGGGFFSVEVRPIVPDLTVREMDGHLEVSCPENLPRLRVHPHYQTMLEKLPDSPELGQFVRSRARSARWFVHALDRRRQTLLRVMRAILAEQEAFFELGAPALRPLTLQQIATPLGLHESTVARVTRDKYVDTPRGIFPLKFFFSSRISTVAGEATSGRAVKARIRLLIQAESPERPLSDDSIARSLGREGIRIARRTVAKYRDQMKIERAQLRRSAGSVRANPSSRRIA